MPEGALAEAVAEVLSMEEKASLRVHGRSMWPWVLPGTNINLIRASSEELVPGDLVLYRRGHGLVLHRAIRRVCGGWLFRADGASQILEEVSDAGILARSADLVLGPLQFGKVPRRVEIFSGWLMVKWAPGLSRAARRIARLRATLSPRVPG